MLDRVAWGLLSLQVDSRRRRLRMMVESSTLVHAWRGFGLGAENLGNQEYGSARADISRVVAG
jgi:hypothetical protein